MLSIDEKVFAQKIFHRYVNDKPKRMEYDEHCLRFCVSLVWRVLHHLWVEDAATGEPLQPEFEGQLDAPYRVWREFLLRQRANPNGYTINVIPVDDIVGIKGDCAPVGLSQYFTGSIDNDLICNSTSGYVYAKIPHFLIFGKIFARSSNSFSKNTLIRVRKGILGGNTLRPAPDVWHYILERANWAQQCKSRLSDRQKEMIQSAIAKDPSRVQNSRTQRSAMADRMINNNRNQDTGEKTQ